MLTWLVCDAVEKLTGLKMPKYYKFDEATGAVRGARSICVTCAFAVDLFSVGVRVDPRRDWRHPVLHQGAEFNFCVRFIQHRCELEGHGRGYAVLCAHVGAHLSRALHGKKFNPLNEYGPLTSVPVEPRRCCAASRATETS